MVCLNNSTCTNSSTKAQHVRKVIICNVAVRTANEAKEILVIHMSWNKHTNGRSCHPWHMLLNSFCLPTLLHNTDSSCWGATLHFSPSSQYAILFLPGSNIKLIQMSLSNFICVSTTGLTHRCSTDTWWMMITVTVITISHTQSGITRSHKIS